MLPVLARRPLQSGRLGRLGDEFWMMGLVRIRLWGRPSRLPATRG